MKIIITGGSGFIGSNLIKKLQTKHDITNIDKQGKNKHVNCKTIKGDITNKEDLKKLPKNVDCIMHLAADPDVKNSINPTKTFNNNVIGSYNILEHARINKIKQIVFTSTCTVYKPNNKPLTENDPTGPISNYGASKAAIENFIHSYNHCYGIKATIIRYANIYGPPSNHGVMNDFYQKLKNNPETLKILGNGKQKKSYLYIDDAVNGLINAWKNTETIETYNIGHDEWTTVNKIADHISNELKLNPKKTYTGGNKGWIGDVPQIKLDNQKIKQTGWKPTINIEQGIKKYVNWLKENQ